MASTIPTFPHRLRVDGTYDSICTQCFETVATSKIEAELLEVEKMHICTGLDLDRIFHPPDMK